MSTKKAITGNSIEEGKKYKINFDGKIKTATVRYVSVRGRGYTITFLIKGMPAQVMSATAFRSIIVE